MTRLLPTSLIVGLLTAVPGVASATTINFGALSQPGASIRPFGASLTFGGFVFTSSFNHLGNGLSVWQASSPDHPVGGDPATSLFEYFAEETTTITRSGGGSFELNGIDLANWGAALAGFPATFNVTFTGTRTDASTVVQTFTVNNVIGPPQLQSFVFSGFTGLVNVRMQQGVYINGTGFQFNNLVVDAAPTGPVSAPEPATLTLLGGGLIALARRRKKTSRTSSFG